MIEAGSVFFIYKVRLVPGTDLSHYSDLTHAPGIFGNVKCNRLHAVCCRCAHRYCSVAYKVLSTACRFCERIRLSTVEREPAIKFFLSTIR